MTQLYTDCVLLYGFPWSWDDFDNTPIWRIYDAIEYVHERLKEDGTPIGWTQIQIARLFKSPDD